VAAAWAVIGGGLGGEGVLLSISWPMLITAVLLGTGAAALAGIYPARLAAHQPILTSIMHFE
jgi:ABC-type antimicrobial peptide transport system permease subunit